MHFYRVKIIKHLSERNFLFFAIVWTVFITVASLVSFNSVPKVAIPGNDKLVHFLFYFFFVVFWSIALHKNFYSKKYSFIIVVFAIVYGIIIEVLQELLTTTREPDLYDVFANALGAIIGYFGFYCLKYKFFNKFF